MTPTPARDTAIPMRAVRIGRPIAMRDPNATSKTTIAATIPTTSLAGIEPFVNQPPENCTSTP